MCVDKKTENRICEQYRYDSREGYGKECVEMLAVANKCSIDDIVTILQTNGLAMHFYDKNKDGKENDMARECATRNVDNEIIKLWNEGVSAQKISERLVININTLKDKLKKMRAHGEIQPHQRAKFKLTPALPNPLDATSDEKFEKKAIEAVTKKEPAPSANDTSSENINISDIHSINPASEIVKLKVYKATAAQLMLEDFALTSLTELFSEIEVIGRYALNQSGEAEINIKTELGDFVLQLRKIEN